MAAASRFTVRQFGEWSLDVTLAGMKKGPLAHDSVRREWRKGELVLPKLRFDRREPVHKRGGPIHRELRNDTAIPGKTQPFVIEPVIDLNDPQLLRSLLSEQPFEQRVQQCDEVIVVRQSGWYRERHSTIISHFAALA